MSTNSTIWKDTFWMLCDEQIGCGMSRIVYSSQILKDSVVKVEDSVCNFQNVIEWETWNRIKETDLAKWFAPCEWISPNGSVLVMKKTYPVPPDNLPEKMPVFFTDFKSTNYGMHNKHIVCHDYGTSLIFEYGMSRRLKKAKWWDA
jgi:hypothetical protein